MKTKSFLTLVAALFAVAFISTTAFAEAIGGGSIRVTLSPENAANLKIRYYTTQGNVEKLLPVEEVLHLSTTSMTNMNEFSLVKEETTGFIINGNPNDTIVQLSFEKEGTHEFLQLDYQWYPKLEILTSAEKVEVLNENGDVLHEVGADPLQLTSSNGMAVRFVVSGADQGGDNQVPTDDNNDLAPAPQAEATGGCHMAAGVSGTLGNAWLILLPVVFAAVRRIRRK